MIQKNRIVSIFVLALVLVVSYDAASAKPSGFLESLLNQEKNENKIQGDNGELFDNYLAFIDYFLLDIVPIFIGQAPNNENGTKSEFKDYVMNDVSNDDASKLTAQELITRSGFKYEIHDAIADDGYITTLTRIINPLASRNHLRQPPFLLEHGGTIDPSAYLVASSIQHHPEKWPRSENDGPITSWNRSLAFTLANNGFDVWLAETRGSNEKNERHIRTKAAESIAKGQNENKNMTKGENINELLSQWNYWSFSQDDIIAHELKSHMDTVLNITGSSKLLLMTYSLSTPTSLAFFSVRPDYAKKVQGFISMAPIISGHGVNKVIKFCLQGICPMIPDTVGTLLWTDLMFSQPMRDVLVTLSKNKSFRYSIIKAITTFLAGPSAKYQTLLDLNVIGHLLRQLSFKEAKQMCQQTKANKLQKYDYGPIKNQLLYNSTEPPVYNLSNIHVKDWIVIGAANDKLATPEILDHLIELVNPKPIAKILVPEFNHLDLIAGFNNDKYVNLPILAYLKSKSFVSNDGYDLETAGARGLNLKAFLPPELMPEKISDTANELTKSMANLTSIDPRHIFESIQKNLNILSKGLGNLFKLNNPKDDIE